MKVTWCKGDDYKENDADFTTYGIHKCVDGKIEHANAVCVYSSESDRDFILSKLGDPQ
jgi:hypothetical protein